MSVAMAISGYVKKTNALLIRFILHIIYWYGILFFEYTIASINVNIQILSSLIG